MAARLLGSDAECIGNVGRVRVSHERRMLFVHVQKTGGSTVQELLDKHLPDTTKIFPKHAGLTPTLREHPALAGYWIFGFVRNPWARMVSWWSKIQAAYATDPNHRFFQTQAYRREIARYPDFETFVQRAPNAHRRFRTPQLAYLTAASGRRADFIGRTETFGPDMRAVAARLDLPQVEIPHTNRSEHGHYRDYYTDSSRKCVADLFAKDIEAFGYAF